MFVKDDSVSRTARDMAVDVVADEVRFIVNDAGDAAKLAEVMLQRSAAAWHLLRSVLPEGPETTIAVMFFAASLVEGLDTVDEKRMFTTCRKAVRRVKEIQSALGDAAVLDGCPIMPRGQA